MEARLVDLSLRSKLLGLLVAENADRKNIENVMAMLDVSFSFPVTLVRISQADGEAIQFDNIISSLFSSGMLDQSHDFWSIEADCLSIICSSEIHSQDFGRMDSKSLFHTYRIDSAADNIAYSQFGQYVRENNIFETSFDSYFTKALPDLNGNIGYGRSFDVGSHKFNLLASFSIKSGDETVRDAFYRTYEASSSGSMRSEYNYDSYKRKLDIAGLLNLEQTLRESDSISLTAFFARNAENSFLNRHGMDWFESYDLTGHNFITHYYTLQNYQLSGHHENDDHSWLFDWGASASFTSSDEPDRRQVMFRRNSSGDLNFFKLNAQETQRYFGSLDENEFVVSEKNTRIFNDDYTLKFGVTGKYKTRNFDVTRFYYDVDDINDVITDTWDVDRYLGFDAIGSGLVTVDRNKQKRNHYEAYNAIAAAYIEADMQLSGRWFLNAGLRFEASRQSVSYTTDYSTDEVRNIDAFDLFPAINLKYSLNNEHAFRMSLSRTITRPSFVEMAPFLYEETFGGAQIRGNEELQNGYNYNFDLKYEYFRENSTDMVGVTAYYKYLDNPIERIQRLSGGAVEHSFNNADSGMGSKIRIFKAGLGPALQILHDHDRRGVIYVFKSVGHLHPKDKIAFHFRIVKRRVAQNLRKESILAFIDRSPEKIRFRRRENCNSVPFSCNRAFVDPLKLHSASSFYCRLGRHFILKRTASAVLWHEPSVRAGLKFVYDRLVNSPFLSLFRYFCLTPILLTRSPMSSRQGKTVPARIPIFRLSPITPDTIPTNVGPVEQPTSPASAISANMAVPPFGRAADALLKVPGHMIPTDSPHAAQAMRLSPGTGRRDIPRYERMHRPLLQIMNRSRLIRSPYFP